LKTLTPQGADYFDPRLASASRARRLALALRLVDDKYSERADPASALPNSFSQIRFSSCVSPRVMLRCNSAVTGAASVIAPVTKSIGVFGSSKRALSFASTWPA
jgi:hypothetical protein